MPKFVISTDVAEQRGLEQGIEQGIEQGREQGREQECIEKGNPRCQLSFPA